MASRKAHTSGAVAAHVRISLDMLNSPSFCALSAYEVKLYVDMRSKLRSTNNGNIDAALTTLRHRGWSSPTTLAKCLRALEAVGLIAKTRATVGVENGSKVCNLYRFTDLDVFEQKQVHVNACKASDDWRKFETLRHAKAVLRDARQVPTNEPRKKTTLQKLERHATETVAMGGIDATDSVVMAEKPEEIRNRETATNSAQTRINTSVAPNQATPMLVGDRLQNLYTLPSTTTPYSPEEGERGMVKTSHQRVAHRATTNKGRKTCTLS